MYSLILLTSHRPRHAAADPPGSTFRFELRQCQWAPVGILGPYLGGGDLLLKRRPLALSLVRGGRGPGGS